MTKLDKKDQEILNILKQNAKMTTQQISRKTWTPITTIHNRIKKMEKEGIIKNYTVVLDHKKIGRMIGAYVLISVEYNKQYSITDQLRKNPLVEEVNMVTGSSDIIAKVRVATTDELEDFVLKYLQKLGGIIKTQTSLILNEK
jgi:Lrp/AsnC family transcriptional regulator for asnA, asnC and gidA